jgi:hypothetical protein
MILQTEDVNQATEEDLYAALTRDSPWPIWTHTQRRQARMIGPGMEAMHMQAHEVGVWRPAQFALSDSIRRTLITCAWFFAPSATCL